MGQADYFLPGAWNFRCQECGQKLKSTVGRLRWDGLWVGPECYELRNPQDFVRAMPEELPLPWSTGDYPLPTSTRHGRLIDQYLIDTITIG